MPKIAVLGLGYTGLRILHALRQEHEVLGFSRKTQEGDSFLLDVSDRQQILQFRERFSGSKEVQNFGEEFASSKEIDGSGKTISGAPFDFSLITFPIHKLEPKELLLQTLFSVSKQVWLLGTTSIYTRNGSEITESSPKEKDHDRYDTEASFLEMGGRILYLSGIYGPGRNPGDWIRKGLIKKTKRQLNLIHGDDIADAIRLLFSYEGRDLPSELVLSDQQWHTWFEVFRLLEEQGKISSFPDQAMDREDGFVDSSLIRKFLPSLQTKDFWRELEKLEELP
ncbi:hypothetical protein EHQ53_04240 [Leptospira langatensis]|uniref:NAD(P)-dependent oxidoreductase n=1 Tax=Leptospira langatensis TaxID=2484983 RepID=A0A5F1ZY59_9LEPT|nr:hypothetical protein [Leptospira langatensis]TGK00035.1 hypothetical protein EHO57_12105 [Leptospira langatensis]TGL42670.1 hypothetical protein EHQ53_04240 [Leptospira langatensis]